MKSPVPHSHVGIKRPHAILFDHDGVLVASEPLHWAAWRRLLQDLQIPYIESDIRAMIGKTAPEMISTLYQKYRPELRPGDYDPNALASQKNIYYLDSVSTQLRAYPGVEEGLRWLKLAGIRTAVVSNARRRELLGGLETLKLTSFFDAIVSRDDAGVPKPDPTPYLMAAAAVGTDLSQCLAVEDSPTGMESALTAKIPTAGILTHFPPETLEAPVPGRPDLKPIWIGPSIKALFQWLKQL